MRLIDADSLLEALHETLHEYEEDIEFTNGIDFAMGLINEQTTIDVSELKEIFELVIPVVRDCYEAVLPIVKEQMERPLKKDKCKHIKYCPFRRAYGYCIKQIGEECQIVWEVQTNAYN